MKKLLFLFVVTALATMTFSDGYGQKSKKDKAKAIPSEIKESVNNKGVIEFGAKMMIEPGSQSIHFSDYFENDFYLCVANDSVFSRLPTMKTIGSKPEPYMSFGELFCFDSKITNYKVKETKKGKMVITFYGRNFDGQVKFTITISPDLEVDVYADYNGFGKSYLGKFDKDRYLHRRFDVDFINR